MRRALGHGLCAHRAESSQSSKLDGVPRLLSRSSKPPRWMKSARGMSNGPMLTHMAASSPISCGGGTGGCCCCCCCCLPVVFDDERLGNRVVAVHRAADALPLSDSVACSSSCCPHLSFVTATSKPSKPRKPMPWARRSERKRPMASGSQPQPPRSSQSSCTKRRRAPRATLANVL